MPGDPRPADAPLDETWNTCSDCFRKWKDAVPTPGVVHRTKRCVPCQQLRDDSPKFDRFGYSGADYEGD